jgi:uncharacterized damage-inducible protein DinB
VEEGDYCADWIHGQIQHLRGNLNTGGPMTVNDFRELYDYSYWANRQLLTVAAKLTPDEFIRPVTGGWGSVRTTLVHTMSAEWGWVARSGGPERGNRLNPDDYPTLDALVNEWKTVEGHVRGFLETLSDPDLERSVAFELDGTRLSMTVSEMLRHAAVHGVHHRGQVAMLLRQLGQTPGNFDLLFYFPETRGTTM